LRNAGNHDKLLGIPKQDVHTRKIRNPVSWADRVRRNL
jgi:hypothetical protein